METEEIINRLERRLEDFAKENPQVNFDSEQTRAKLAECLAEEVSLIANIHTYNVLQQRI